MADENGNRLVEKRDIIYIVILAAIALAIGVYLIATTVLIAKDGMRYIECAQSFSENPTDVIKQHETVGYSFLIFLTHKIVTFFYHSPSIHVWIYSAQSVSLLCRLLSLVPLYFTGKLLVGRKKSFWAMLILILLPYPAEFGSDVIREWPHILFLSAGILFLILGVKSGKWWMFALAGSITGLGYMIRPECAQVIIYGVLWLLISLFLPRQNIGRIKAICMMLILVVGFAIPAAPYMGVKNKILPIKLKGIIFSNTQPIQSDSIEQRNANSTPTVYTSSAVPFDILNAFIKLIQRISENLIYFYVPLLAVGFYSHYHRLRKILRVERFFIFAIVMLYLTMMTLLYVNHGYVGRRHCMPMVAFTVFYIPVGVQILARWLAKKASKHSLDAHRDRHRYFFILMAIGFIICGVRFIKTTPLRWEKQGYLDASDWLKKEVGAKDAVMVPDKRISFYAECRQVKKFKKEVRYIVKKMKNEEEVPQGMKIVWSQYLNKNKREKVVIYGRI